MNPEPQQSQYAPPAPYGYPMSAAPMPAPQKTNGLAITAFVLGILGFALIPVIMGHISVSQIRQRGDAGMGFAVAGLILGYLACLVYLVLIVIAVIAVGFAVSSA